MHLSVNKIRAQARLAAWHRDPFSAADALQVDNGHYDYKWLWSQLTLVEDCT